MKRPGLQSASSDCGAVQSPRPVLGRPITCRLLPAGLTQQSKPSAGHKTADHLQAFARHYQGCETVPPACAQLLAQRSKPSTWMQSANHIQDLAQRSKPSTIVQRQWVTCRQSPSDQSHPRSTVPKPITCKLSPGTTEVVRRSPFRAQLLTQRSKPPAVRGQPITYRLSPTAIHTPCTVGMLL